MKKQIRNIILMLALCLGMSGMTALAANDKMEYRDHLYQRFDTGMTWTAAKEYCKKLGGHLVVITSASEQNKVQSLIAKGTQKQYWLGAKRDMNKRNFVWVNGAKFAYANWSKGEPNNYRSEEGYVQMYRVPNPHNYSADSFGKWNDINNENHIYDEEDFFTTDQVGFICEFDKGWKKISPAKVTLSTKTYTYSGNQKKPAVTVKMGRTKLVKGKDYKVSYRSNTKPGKANVTITGIGKYKGTKTVHFTIKPRRVQSLSVKSGKSKSAAVSWKARREADGYEVQYCKQILQKSGYVCD